jgi:hypothetical protein
MGDLMGFMAIDQYGQTIHLQGKESPRKQLADKLAINSSNLHKMYVDCKDKQLHVGYIAAKLWFRIYAVHSWQGND